MVGTFLIISKTLKSIANLTPIEKSKLRHLIKLLVPNKVVNFWNDIFNRIIKSKDAMEKYQLLVNIIFPIVIGNNTENLYNLTSLEPVEFQSENAMAWLKQLLIIYADNSDHFINDLGLLYAVIIQNASKHIIEDFEKVIEMFNELCKNKNKSKNQLKQKHEECLQNIVLPLLYRALFKQTYEPPFTDTECISIFERIYKNTQTLIPKNTQTDSDNVLIDYDYNAQIENLNTHNGGGRKIKVVKTVKTVKTSKK